MVPGAIWTFSVMADHSFYACKSLEQTSGSAKMNSKLKAKMYLLLSIRLDDTGNGRYENINSVNHSRMVYVCT